MKSILMLVAASVMLVGATIGVAIPNQAEAAWCPSNDPFTCYKSKDACRDAIPDGITATCDKVPKKR